MKRILQGVVYLLLFSACKKDNSTIATLTTSSASNITASSAQVGGGITSNGGSGITQSGVCWALHTNPTVGDSLSPASAVSGNFTCNLSNLSANVTYYYRAYATNAVGTAYGPELSFITLKGLASVTTAAISNILPLVATSGGTVSSDGGASVTARGLVYGTSAHPTLGSNFFTVDNSGTGNFVDSLKPLASQTVYYVRAYATNSYGTAYGNEISFTSSSANTVVDVDGNVYSYITIGGQSWMTSDLKVTHYQNGDTIINGFRDNFGWWATLLNKTYIGAFTYPNGDSTLKSQYGLLYNPYAIDDPRILAPKGWHVATDAEWETLEYNQGMLASDTGLNGIASRNMTNPIGSKLLVGGSTGLNLRLGGNLTASSSSSTYVGFGTNFCYMTGTSTTTGVARLANFVRFFGDPSAMNVDRQASYQFAGAVRCVKDN